MRRCVVVVAKAEWQNRLDTWFPTALRYAGLALIVYAALWDHGKNPALIPAATGMIFFKTIYGSGEKS
jgi:hypothetical protein